MGGRLRRAHLVVVTTSGDERDVIKCHTLVFCDVTHVPMAIRRFHAHPSTPSRRGRTSGHGA